MSIGAHSVFADMPEAFLDSLGVDCVVIVGGAGPVTLRGILRDPHGRIVDDAGFGEPGVNGARPTASFAAADVPGLNDGDSVTLAGATWIIREPLPDGRGMVRCELEEA